MKALRGALLGASRGDDRRDGTPSRLGNVDAEDLAAPLTEAVPQGSGPGADRRVEKVFALLVVRRNGRRPKLLCAACVEPVTSADAPVPGNWTLPALCEDTLRLGRILGLEWHERGESASAMPSSQWRVSAFARHDHPQRQVAQDLGPGQKEREEEHDPSRPRADPHAPAEPREHPGDEPAVPRAHQALLADAGVNLVQLALGRGRGVV